MKDAPVLVKRVARTVLMLCDFHHSQEEYGSHPKPILRAILYALEGWLKEDVMVSQDYLFMVLLVISVLYFVHWGGGHSWRH